MISKKLQKKETQEINQRKNERILHKSGLNLLER